jgi:hypothetical protein
MIAESAAPLIRYRLKQQPTLRLQHGCLLLSTDLRGERQVPEPDESLACVDVDVSRC